METILNFLNVLNTENTMFTYLSVILTQANTPEWFMLNYFWISKIIV